MHRKSLKDSICSSAYAIIHRWLKHKFGKATFCENPNCEGWCKFFQYSLIKGKKYEKNRSNFRTLCISCHTKYDYTEYKLHILKTREYSEETRRKISESLTGHKLSDECKRKLSERFSGSGNPMFGISVKGKDHHFYGKHHTVETKEKLLAYRAKVSKEQVDAIRKENESGISQRAIAKRYNISTASVCRIVNHKRYKLW